MFITCTWMFLRQMLKLVLSFARHRTMGRGALPGDAWSPSVTEELRKGVDDLLRTLRDVSEALSEKVFVSQKRVSGFPEKGADLRGSAGTSGEVWGTSGEVRETSGEPLDCC